MTEQDRSAGSTSYTVQTLTQAQEGDILYTERQSLSESSLHKCKTKQQELNYK